ncbi:hypothetical protein FRC03_004561 [Tulasnella sp. 419]|nr:hypothetical protein FRC03_004561 [Tulasnella sp. 419]
MSLENAKAALRTCQNKVLGFGRRARAVSVNISSQEELMKELFPTWRGHFIGSQPSVNGLEGGPLTEVLDAGLISFDELDSLLALLRNPNAHFLKVPSLPYHSLISILQKFPVHGDSRVFWTNVLRDQLFTVAHAAVKILTAQWEQPDFDADLFDQVAAAAATCPAFTDIQRHLITEIATAPSFADLPSLDRSLSNSPVPMETVPPTPQDEHEHQLFQPQSSMSDNPATSSYYNPGPANAKPMLPRALFDEIGNEVGVDATLVRMIFQKLTHMVL